MLAYATQVCPEAAGIEPDGGWFLNLTSRRETFPRGRVLIETYFRPRRRHLCEEVGNEEEDEGDSDEIGGREAALPAIGGEILAAPGTTPAGTGGNGAPADSNGSAGKKSSGRVIDDDPFLVDDEDYDDAYDDDNDAYDEDGEDEDGEDEDGEDEDASLLSDEVERTLNDNEPAALEETQQS